MPRLFWCIVKYLHGKVVWITLILQNHYFGLLKCLLLWDTRQWLKGKIVFITSHQTATRKTILLKHLNTVPAKHNTDYHCVHRHILKTSTSGINEVFIPCSNSTSSLSECCYWNPSSTCLKSVLNLSHTVWRKKSCTESAGSVLQLTGPDKTFTRTNLWIRTLTLTACKLNRNSKWMCCTDQERLDIKKERERDNATRQKVRRRRRSSSSSSSSSSSRRRRRRLLSQSILQQENRLIRILLNFNFQMLIVPQTAKQFHKFFETQMLILGPQECTAWNCCLIGWCNSTTVNTHNSHRTKTSTT